MADYDEYEIAAAHRMQELHAAKMQTITNMEVYKSRGDVAGMGEEIERLAQIREAERSINALQAEHRQSKIPVQQQQLTKEMLDQKPPELMDWNDTWRMTAQTAKNETELKLMADKFREGMDTVMREKQTGGR